MSDAAKSIANWDAGFDTAAVKAKVDKKRPDMLSRMGSQTTPIVSM